MDQQVKVRGHLIEAGEVEAALAEHAAVKQSVVLARGAGNGEQQLVAYLVWAGAEIEVGELRAHLRERLPEYMVPNVFVAVAELPLTANGKVDRQRLAKLEIGQQLGATAYVAPRTATEELLCELWKSLLKGERIGIHDNFFELGGHSLLATKVIARARE